MEKLGLGKRRPDKPRWRKSGRAHEPPYNRRRTDQQSGPPPPPYQPYPFAGASWPFASPAAPQQQQQQHPLAAAIAATLSMPPPPPVAAAAVQKSPAAPVQTRAVSPPEAPAKAPPGNAPEASSDAEHSRMQELLRRIMELEFAGRCTQRSVAILKAICETLCTTPAALIKAMEVVNENFDAAVRSRQQSQLLNCWYIVDAVMKSFREKPKMLHAMEVPLPHLLLQYVPWKGSDLAKQPWVSREADSDRYAHLFETWGGTLSEQLHEAIMDMWEGGISTESSEKTFGEHSR